MSNAKDSETYVEPTKTKWTNGHDKETCRFHIVLAHGAEKVKARILRYEIKPGQSVEIDSTFDRAIQVTDEDGNVVGGKAPWLTKDGKKPKLIKALDWISEREEAELQNEVDRIRDEQIRTEAKTRLAAAKAQKKV